MASRSVDSTQTLVVQPVKIRVNQAVSLGYVASRTVESTIIVMGLISLMSVVTLRHDLAGAGVDAGSLKLVGRPAPPHRISGGGLLALMDKPCPAVRRRAQDRSSALHY